MHNSRQNARVARKPLRIEYLSMDQASQVPSRLGLNTYDAFDYNTLQDQGWRQILRRDKDAIYKEIFQNEDKDFYVNGIVRPENWTLEFFREGNLRHGMEYFYNMSKNTRLY
jgi:hypothetical protein